MRKEAGLLKLLLIPKRPWASISMDFISGIPKFNDISVVMVVVNRLTKYAIFILTSVTCLAEKAAALFLHHVVKHIGVPQDIVSDRDSHS